MLIFEFVVEVAIKDSTNCFENTNSNVRKKITKIHLHQKEVKENPLHRIHINNNLNIILHKLISAVVITTSSESKTNPTNQCQTHVNESTNSENDGATSNPLRRTRKKRSWFELERNPDLAPENELSQIWIVQCFEKINTSNNLPLKLQIVYL